MDNQKLHIAIIGAGITGTTLSLALSARGIAHTVYEQSRHPTELGAGLGLGPNAARALRIAHRGVYERFLEVCTPRDMRWKSASKVESQERKEKEEGKEEEEEEEKVWIHFLDGTSPLGARDLPPAFRIPCPYPEGHGAVHRARWLEVLMGMVGEGVVQFGKRLERIEDQGPGGKMVLRFEDGTIAEADAVVGCDGVKSKVREVLVGGRDQDGAKCGYSGKYAYRCMIPMDQAVEELGPARAGCSSLWVSPFPFKLVTEEGLQTGPLGLLTIRTRG
jgi:salicylate hydroxylase